MYATVARTGSLLYRNNDGSTRTEIVSREELRNPASLNSASMKPITFLHPPGGWVTPENARQYQRGMSSQKLLIDDDFLTVVCTLTDAEAIGQVKSGAARQMSAGYAVSTTPRGDGTFEQHNRIYNHFAIVPAGRAGAYVRIHIDGEESVSGWVLNDLCEPPASVLSGRRNDKAVTRQIIIDDVGYQVEDSGLESAIAKLKSQLNQTQSELKTLVVKEQALKDEKARFDSQIKVLESELQSLKSEKSRVDGELVGVKTQLQQLESNRIDEAEVERRVRTAIATRIDETLALWSQVLPRIRKDAPDYKPDYKLSPTEIRKLYLSKVVPDIKLDAADDNFIAGLWMGLKPKPRDETEDAIAKTKQHLDFVLTHTHVDDSNSDGSDAIKRAQEEMRTEIEGASRRK